MQAKINSNLYSVHYTCVDEYSMGALELKSSIKDMTFQYEFLKDLNSIFFVEIPGRK